MLYACSILVCFTHASSVCMLRYHLLSVELMSISVRLWSMLWLLESPSVPVRILARCRSCALLFICADILSTPVFGMQWLGWAVVLLELALVGWRHMLISLLVCESDCLPRHDSACPRILSVF